MAEDEGSQQPEAVNLRDALARSRIAGDLVETLRSTRPEATRAVAGLTAAPTPTVSVIVEANAGFPLGPRQARDLLVLLWVRHRPDDKAKLHRQLLVDPERSGIVLPDADPFEPEDEVDVVNSLWTDTYLFGLLTHATIEALAEAHVRVPLSTGETREAAVVYKVWNNHDVHRYVTASVRTVKCDAARAAFAATGEGVVWAVADTGIDGKHPHFLTHDTLVLPDGLDHADFTGGVPQPLVDETGHGTHVGGIIAGETRVGSDTHGVATISIDRSVRTSDTQIDQRVDTGTAVIAGLSPLCKLVSLKVMDDEGSGDVGRLLAAIGYLQQVNDYGRNLRVHGLNISLGYTFDARWFAAGRSPLCVEVDRLVRSGVVVVVAAGNGGYGTVQSLTREVERAAHLGSISDPGNAERAITVGATHRDEPHNFGVSYFSAKGPTADGRMKPDLVAPGERIVSAWPLGDAPAGTATFREDTGTSMSAPHVSGCIAAFLSVRREFLGAPERVKEIFMGSATDLRRRSEFQGAGLIDTMRALQSV